MGEHLAETVEEHSASNLPDIVSSMLEAVAKFLTRGEHQKGDWWLAVEYRDGKLSRTTHGRL